jgi:hypothetical protein
LSFLILLGSQREGLGEKRGHAHSLPVPHAVARQGDMKGVCDRVLRGRPTDFTKRARRNEILHGHAHAFGKCGHTLASGSETKSCERILV